VSYRLPNLTVKPGSGRTGQLSSPVPLARPGQAVPHAQCPLPNCSPLSLVSTQPRCKHENATGQGIPPRCCSGTIPLWETVGVSCVPNLTVKRGRPRSGDLSPSLPSPKPRASRTIARFFHCIFSPHQRPGTRRLQLRKCGGCRKLMRPIAASQNLLRKPNQASSAIPLPCGRQRRGMASCNNPDARIGQPEQVKVER